MKSKIFIYLIAFIFMFGLVNATQYNYWLENSTSMYVKFNITNGTPLVLYIQNGSVGDSVNNGNSVFVIFDDFNDNSLNTTKWNLTKGANVVYNESNGYLNITNPTASWSALTYAQLRSQNQVVNGMRGYRTDGNLAMSDTAHTTIAHLGFYNSTFAESIGTLTSVWSDGNSIYTFSGHSSNNVVFDTVLRKQSLLWESNNTLTWTVNYYRNDVRDTNPSTPITMINLTNGSYNNRYPAYFIVSGVYDAFQSTIIDWVSVSQTLNRTPSINCVNNTCTINSNITDVDVTYRLTGNFDLSNNIVTDVFGCTENWVNYNTTCNGFNYTVLYNDTNNCGTNTTLPISNGTIVNCTICTPMWVTNDTICNGYNYTIQYYDINDCGDYSTLPIDNGTIVNCTTSCNWTLQPQPCLNNVRLIFYTSNVSNCTETIPSNNGTYVDCSNIVYTQVQRPEYFIPFLFLFVALVLCTVLGFWRPVVFYIGALLCGMFFALCIYYRLDIVAILISLFMVPVYVVIALAFSNMKK